MSPTPNGSTNSAPSNNSNPPPRPPKPGSPSTSTTSVRAAHAARGIPAERQGRGVAGQVALARQESPYKGGRHLGLAKVLAGEMPHTLAALQRGVISEWRATLLARETLFLSREHRQLIDTQLCADPTILDGWGDKRLTNEIQKIAYQLDPAGSPNAAAKPNPSAGSPAAPPRTRWPA